MPGFVIFGMIAWVIWIIIVTLWPYLLTAVLLMGVLNYLIDAWNLFTSQDISLRVAEAILAGWSLVRLNRWVNDYTEEPRRPAAAPPRQQIVTRLPGLPQAAVHQSDLTTGQKRHIKRLQRAARRAGW